MLQVSDEGRAHVKNISIGSEPYIYITPGETF